MFAVHVSNPFNSAKRAQQKDDKIIEDHKREMEERERIQQSRHEGRKNISEGLGSGGRGGYGGYGGSAASNAERSRYQFEADESDDEKEKEIEHNLDQLGNITGRLKNLAVATGKEVDRQNKQIDEIINRVSYVIVLLPFSTLHLIEPCANPRNFIGGRCGAWHRKKYRKVEEYSLSISCNFLLLFLFFAPLFSSFLCSR